MNIYKLQNILYTDYSMNNRLNNKNKTLFIQNSNHLANNQKRAIGEEISNFYKINKKTNRQYTIIPWIKSFNKYK